MRPDRRTWALVALCLAVGAGVGALWVAVRDAQPEEAPASEWPEEARVPLDIARPTLVLFVHPGSPHTREALAELARLERRTGGRLAISVRVYRPDGPIAGWDQMPIWKAASELSADVASDPSGAQARLFGARPSGEAVVFAPSGRKLFQGEIAARGRGFALRERLTRVLDAWRALETRPIFGRRSGPAGEGGDGT